MSRRPISLQKRFRILKRDRFTCQYCGRSAKDVELEIDHTVPYSKGGDDSELNLVAACRDCNSGKTDKLISRLAHRLRFLRDNLEGSEDVTANKLLFELFFPLHMWLEPDLYLLRCSMWVVIQNGVLTEEDWEKKRRHEDPSGGTVDWSEYDLDPNDSGF